MMRKFHFSLRQRASGTLGSARLKVPMRKGDIYQKGLWTHTWTFYYYATWWCARWSILRRAQSFDFGCPHAGRAYSLTKTVQIYNVHEGAILVSHLQKN